MSNPIENKCKIVGGGYTGRPQIIDGSGNGPLILVDCDGKSRPLELAAAQRAAGGPAIVGGGPRATVAVVDGSGPGTLEIRQ